MDIKIDIKHIAQLAALKLDSSLAGKLEMQLERILDFVSKLQKVDTKNVAPTSQVTGLENVTREDEIDNTRMLSQKQALANANETHNGFFKVPFVWS